MELIIFTILLVIVFIILILRSKNSDKEHFSSDMKEKRKMKAKIYNILPAFDNSFCGLRKGTRNKNPIFIGTFVPEEGESNANMIYTRSLKSNTWYGPMANSMIDGSNGIFVDLTYDKDRKLLGVCLEEENGNYKYNLYKKATNDLCSKWIKLPKSDDPHEGKMRSIIYDLDGRLIGCNSEDGQLYKKESSSFSSEWIGPINVDMPIKKVMFDHIDEIMLGIGKEDNKIYRKSGKDWTREIWDKQYSSNIEVMDIFHDLDGCLVASTKNGLMKQVEPNFLSEFVDIEETKITTPLFDNDKRMRYRTGLNLVDKSMKDNNELTNKLDDILTFKKEAKEICKNKKFLFSKEDNDSVGVKDIKKQNQVIDDIQGLIEIVKKKYDI
jgi:hypothetical protein